MKHILLIATFLTAVSCQLFSQAKPYHVVFDITTGDTATHQRVIRWIKGILKTHPDAEVEVVFYGKSLNMVETENSSVASDVKNLAAGKNVKFAVCEQAMKAHKVDRSMLLPGVNTVPDAIYELISKQADGYGYIKVVN
jgi:intracellular sulfur oxidation DsrE/DsrF family protein